MSDQIQATSPSSQGTEGNAPRQSGDPQSNLRTPQKGGVGGGVRASADVNAPAMEGFKDPAEARAEGREKEEASPRTGKDARVSASVAPNEGSGEAKEAGDSNRVKLKVYGREREYDLSNLEDRRIVLAEAQKGMAAQQTMQEASQMKKQAEMLWETLQKDPRKALQAGKHDVVALAQQIIAEKIQQEMMDPNERRAYEAERERDQYRQQIEAQKAQAQAQQESAIRDQRARHWEGEILQAIETTADLPKDPMVVREIAKTIIDAKKYGENITAKEAAMRVKTHYIETFNTLVNVMSVDQMTKHFGKEFIDKIRQHSIDELKKPLNPQFAKPPSGTPVQKPQDRRFKTWQEKQAEWDRMTRA